MRHATAHPPLWLLSATGLRRIGVEGLADGPSPGSSTASFLPVDDAPAWNAQIAEAIRATRSTRAAAETVPGSVLLIDGDLTLVGVVKGPLWRLSNAALVEAATRWLVGEDAGDRWTTRVIRDASGHSALCCAVPHIPLQAALEALQTAAVPALCALPVWAVDCAAVQPAATVPSQRRIAAWDGSMDLELSGTPEQWDDAVLRRPGSAEARSQLMVGLAGRTVADWQTPLRPGSLETMRFAGPAPLRAQALTRVAFAALAALLGLALVPLASFAPGQDSGNKTAAVPSGAVSRPLPPRLPVAEADWRQVEADLQRTWLPLLDRVAASRGPGMEFDRIEPITGDAYGIRLSVQGQAPSAQALTAWVHAQALAQVQAPSQPASRGAQALRVRLLGWSAIEADAGAPSARVQFQLEVSDGVRP